MFTGIIESVGSIVFIERDGGNIHFTVQSDISSSLKIDQSVAHNGVCLTVVEVNNNTHRVTAIDETLSKTNLGKYKVGDLLNLERCMRLDDRLDGHMVQGHVDQTAICTHAIAKEGSWEFTFEYDEQKGNITVEKGSICVNGVSLTVVNSHRNAFSVAIIPYTYEHTNFRNLKVGDTVNLEFDIIGKYVARWMEFKR